MLIRFVQRLGFARALQSPAFALLWSGQTISALGDNAYYTALAWQVLLLTGSGTAMGIIGVAGMLPRVLFLLVGGVVADRVPRGLVLLWSDAGRAVVVLVIAALGLLHVMQFWHLVLLSSLFGVADGFFMPAYQAIPPQLLEGDLLPSANALTGVSQQIGELAGPAIGASLVAAASPASAFAFDGFTFLVSALCLLAMRPHARRPPAEAAEASTRLPPTTDVLSAPLAEPATTNTQPAQGLRGIVDDIRVGFGYVVATPWLWITILVASAANIGFAGAYFVAMPRLVRDHFGAGVWLLGVLATSSAIGLLLGTLLIGQFRRVRHRGFVLYASWIALGAAMIVMALPLPHAAAPVIASMASMLSGMGMGVAGVVWTTLLQQRVPPELLGRVTSIDWLGSLALTPIGFIAAGILTDARGPAWVFTVGGASTVTLLFLALCSRDVRYLD